MFYVVYLLLGFFREGRVNGSRKWLSMVIFETNFSSFSSVLYFFLPILVMSNCCFYQVFLLLIRKFLLKLCFKEWARDECFVCHQKSARFIRNATPKSKLKVSGKGASGLRKCSYPQCPVLFHDRCYLNFSEGINFFLF